MDMTDLEELEPCSECGNKCPTQVEETEANGNVPWSTCNACYDRLETVGEAQAPNSAEK